MLISGIEPVTVVLRFDASLANKNIEIKATRSLIVAPAGQAMRLAPTAEAMLQVALQPEHTRGEITFYAGNVTTVLPVMRAPAALVPNGGNSASEEAAQ